jgi:hypothetical protein
VTNTLTQLRNAVRGRVLLPGDEDFDRARQPWNLAVEQDVPAVVEAADADDFTALVRYAAAHALQVSGQPSGHGATGDLNGAILLRTHLLDEVSIDPAKRIARVGAGVRWGEVQKAAGQHGLTGLPGSSPVVTVTGYTLGGGLSWFSRAYGWAADAVTAIEGVSADGHRFRVTAGSDLFWALRGGGGDYALVTAMEFMLHPAPALYGGRMIWPADRASEVLDAYRQVTASAPDALTAWFDLLHFPGTPPMAVVDTTYLGDPDEARDLLRPLGELGATLSDSRGPLPIADLGSVTAEPTEPGAGLSRGELLTALDDRAAKALLAEPIDPLLSVQVRHLGGSLAGPSDTPHGPLTEPYALYMFGTPTSPQSTTDIRTRQQRLVHDLAPSISSRKPYTYLTPGETMAHALTPDALTRLHAIKNRHDPHHTIRSNYPLTP